ncbi:MAG: carbamate kinase, partial [Candidatus Nanopelagicales bacterium]
MSSRSALIAIGGNALVLEGEDGSLVRQARRAAEFGAQLAELVEEGWRIVVSHGNGPQVGYILRRGELVATEAVIEGLPNLPLWLAVADSQGGIGHILTLEIDNALHRRGLPTRATTILTHTEVDPTDPAFDTPTKPIGGTMTADTARLRIAEAGWSVVQTSAGVYRRVVPSPRPLDILECDQIRLLADTGPVVIAAGGGGIPVARSSGGWTSVDAVIDKDRASALLGARIDLDTLVLVTGVDQVYVGFGTPEQRALSQVSAQEARTHLAAGEFPAGSMGPKVESALAFLDAGGHRAIITSITRLPDALRGTAGTHITAQG